MNFIKATVLVLGATVAAQAGAAPESLDLRLTSVDAWICQAQAQAGRAFANEITAFEHEDCPAFLRGEKRIFAPLASAAAFNAANAPELCYLASFRDELQTIAVRMQTTCREQITTNIRAGITLGYAACSLAPSRALTPDLETGRIHASLFDPNGQSYVMTLVMPVRSGKWAGQLGHSEEGGFQIGCILAERDRFNGVPNSYSNGTGKPDWRNAGRNVGDAFANAYCPFEADRVDTIITTLAGSSGTGSDQSLAARDTRLGFEKAFTESCHLDPSPADHHFQPTGGRLP